MRWPFSKPAITQSTPAHKVRTTPGKKLTYGPSGLKAGAGGYASTHTLATTDGKQISGMAMSGERHAMYDRGPMVQQSREFYRDNSIFRGMIDRYVAYVVGNGFSLQAQTGSKRFNAAVEKLWTEYWESPEVRGVLSGSQIETMLFRERLVAGDVAALKISNGTIQLVEGDQITDGQCYGTGIRVNEATGAPIAYAVCPYSQYGYADTARLDWKQARHVLFIADPERPSSIRGIPAVQPAFAMLHRINDMCDATALAASMLAHIALIVNRKNAAESATIDSIIGKANGTGENPVVERVTELDYATIFHGEDGEEIRGVEHNIPGVNFPNNLKMFMRLLGLPLGIPLEVIMLLWSDSNYSQSRAVMEQFFRTIAAHQKFFATAFHRPLYKWKVDQWIKESKLSDVADKYAHEWMTPAFPWLDPYKEAQAHQLKLQLGITTRAKICKSADADPDQILTTRIAEITTAIRAAQGIEKDTGEKVPWQLLAGVEITTSAPASPTPEDPAIKEMEEKDDDGAEADNANTSE